MTRNDSGDTALGNGVIPYPAYKDSRVEWLGDVPEHWQVLRLGQLGEFAKGSGGTKSDEMNSGSPCIRYGDLYTNHEFHITRSRAFIAEDKEANYTPIRHGEVLFAASGETIEEIGKSAVNLIDGKAFCGGDVIVFKPSIRVDARFTGWALDCKYAADQKAAMGRGITVMHIYASNLKRLAIAIPSYFEQTKIAKFLNNADRRIQRYIDAKEKLIGLLEEQKQAIIHGAVTGKIDVRTGRPYPAYRDSGVEWLGEVPRHWEVRPIKTLLQEKTQFSEGGLEIPLSLTRSRGLVPHHEVSTRSLRASDQSKFKVCDPGDLIMNRMQAWSGMFALAGVRGLVSPDYSVFAPRTNSRIEGSYFGRLFKTRVYIDQFAKRSKGVGTGFNRLYTPDFGAVPALAPPHQEQATIARFLGDISESIDHCVTTTRHQIDLLNEYRTRLIADVVTGKLDVRNAVASLEDPESIDFTRSHPDHERDDVIESDNPMTVGGLTGE